MRLSQTCTASVASILAMGCWLCSPTGSIAQTIVETSVVEADKAAEAAVADQQRLLDAIQTDLIRVIRTPDWTPQSIKIEAAALTDRYEGLFATEPSTSGEIVASLQLYQQKALERMSALLKVRMQTANSLACANYRAMVANVQELARVTKTDGTQPNVRAELMSLADKVLADAKAMGTGCES